MVPSNSRLNDGPSLTTERNRMVTTWPLSVKWLCAAERKKTRNGGATTARIALALNEAFPGTGGSSELRSACRMIVRFEILIVSVIQEIRFPDCKNNRVVRDDSIVFYSFHAQKYGRT